MPQLHLPIFPSGVTYITSELAFEKRDGYITYFNSYMPVFRHLAEDVRSFRMITSQFCVTGSTRQIDIVKAFGVSPVSVKRAVKCYRLEGAKGFFTSNTPKRKPRILTPDVVSHAEKLLREGDSITTVANKLGIKRDTLKKAISQGRVRHCQSFSVTTKSERSIQDSQAEMGMGATNTIDRVLASVGKLHGVPTNFTASLDVPHGGLLFSIPALLSCGLLHYTSGNFSFPQGYYTIEQVFLLLAFMGLARLRSIENLRYCAPGEWGKLLGLDRIPEVRTLRQKVTILCENGDVEKWSSQLCHDWMHTSPQMTDALYVDGHVRVYHGTQTHLPRHYVARQRLCLRATTDYWVNALDGQPFFVISKEVDPGLLMVIEHDIVPRLEADVPNQPSATQLQKDSLLHRFCLVFDREGYSPGFMKRMKEKHIACLTYHKYPKGDWPEKEFISCSVTLVSGETVTMKLAERGVYLGNTLWVREIRKLTKTGHQTSILTTNFKNSIESISSAMFARWSQENFFNYMRQHFGLDRIITYETEKVPETTQVVNPEWRKVDSDIRSKNFHLNRLLSQFGELHLEDPLSSKTVRGYEEKKALLLESINGLKCTINNLKEEKKGIIKKINAVELPESDTFKRLKKDSKHFIDTIKMIAYRAETALVYSAREKIARTDDARSLIRAIYNSEADIIPDFKKGILNIKLHHIANHAEGEIIKYLCKELNETQTFFPGTNLILSYDMVSNQKNVDTYVKNKIEV